MNDYENSKRLRVAELLLVLSVAFAPTLFISIYLWFTNAGTDDHFRHNFKLSGLRLRFELKA